MATGAARSAALVTGATGFIGGHLARRLVEAGWRVSVLVRDPARLAPDLRERATIITGSLSDQAALDRAVAACEVVFHCAANAQSWDTDAAYREANVEGPANLVAAIARANPGLGRLLHVSTVDVYGFPETPCDETAAPREAGFGYGDSKLRGEALVRDGAARHGIPLTVIRPGNVIGPGSQFVARIGEALRSGLMIAVDGGRAHAGLIDVDNLCGDMIWAATSPEAAGQCYNARDPGDATWAAFNARLRGAIGGRGLVVSLPFGLADLAARAIEILYRVAPSREPLLHRLLVRMFGRTCGHSAEKLLAARGGAGRIGFDETMRRSAEWYLGTRR